MTIISTIRGSEFCTDFFQTFLRDGFGTLSKRETDLLVLRLLLKHSSRFRVEEPPSAFVLARELRISRNRARALLDELAYREGNNEDLIKKRLRSILLRAEKTAKEGQVAVQIEDGLLREYAKSIVQSEFGTVDTSFDRTIVKISGDRFLALATNLLDSAERKEIEKYLKTFRSELAPAKGSTLLQKLTSVVANRATDEVAGMAIDIAKEALRNGYPLIPAILAQLFM